MFSHHVGPEELRGFYASLGDILWVKSMGVVMGNFKGLAVFPGEKKPIEMKNLLSFN